MVDNFGKITILVVLITCLTFFIGCNVKAAIAFTGAFSLLLFLNVTATTLSNAMLGKDMDTTADSILKLILIGISSDCFAWLYFS
ncbi:MAG: hypothetical protein J6Y37_15690 [Paludibacteraceae bacterium]|nr:hypothetical protein [Paludibacteraceae bacterium]